MPVASQQPIAPPHKLGLSETCTTAVEQLIVHLQKLGLERVGPCHCTGTRAIQQLAAAYGQAHV